MNLDLSRIDLIKNLSLEQLSNCDYLECFIPKLGFNTESLIEQPLNEKPIKQRQSKKNVEIKVLEVNQSQNEQPQQDYNNVK